VGSSGGSLDSVDGDDAQAPAVAVSGPTTVAGGSVTGWLTHFDESPATC
jgi:hypothetical protein